VTEPVSARAAKPPAGRRYLALWFPFLPADRWRAASGASAAPAERPLVFVATVGGARRLVAVDARAAALGLSPGLTLADAEARLPGLDAAPADEAADARFLRRLGGVAERFTPAVALDPPDGLALDITGAAHLFGDEDAVLAAAVAALARCGAAARAAVAGTPDAARALARHGRAGVVPPGGDEAAIRPLPVSALGLAPETVIALARAGLSTVGDIADRPMALFAARFGPDLPRCLARALGREDARIAPLRPPPDLHAERRFAVPVTQAAALQAALAALADELGRQLENRGQGGRRFEAGFFRADGAVRRLAVECGAPSRDPAAIVRLLRERLETLADPLDPGFGFEAVRLAVPAVEPLEARQLGLDGRDRAAADAAALIDRLSARFGRERILRFLPRGTHDPGRAARAVPAVNAEDAAGGAATGAAWPAPEPGEPPARPLHLFDPPQPIEVVAEVPDGPPARFRWRRVLHEVALAEGPERIAPEWWRAGAEPATRDYYRIEDADGRRFWVFRRGLYGGEHGGEHGGGAPPRWFLHGLFA
jgi:protein ImuB